jgi:hypothetical protein
MFALPNPMSQVSSAAFAQARLKPGSSSVQVCSGLLTLVDTSHQNLLTFSGVRICHYYISLDSFPVGLPLSKYIYSFTFRDASCVVGVTI